MEGDGSSLNLAVLGRSCFHLLPCQQHGLQSPASGRCHASLLPCLWVRQRQTSGPGAGAASSGTRGGWALVGYWGWHLPAARHGCLPSGWAGGRGLQHSAGSPGRSAGDLGARVGTDWDCGRAGMAKPVRASKGRPKSVVDLQNGDGGTGVPPVC